MLIGKLRPVAVIVRELLDEKIGCFFQQTDQEVGNIAATLIDGNVSSSAGKEIDSSASQITLPGSGSSMLIALRSKPFGKAPEHVFNRHARLCREAHIPRRRPAASQQPSAPSRHGHRLRGCVAILAFQNSSRVAGHLKRWQLWPCQKQP